MAGGRVTLSRKLLAGRKLPARRSNRSVRLCATLKRLRASVTCRGNGRRFSRAKSSPWIPSPADDRDATSTEGWSSVLPKRVGQRMALPRLCFLVPEKRRYPVCECGRAKYTCKGALAAFQSAERVIRNSRASRKTARSMARAAKWRALKLGLQQGCAWAAGRSLLSSAGPKTKLTARKRGRRVAKSTSRRSQRSHKSKKSHRSARA
jgi:hypothetical protein